LHHYYSFFESKPLVWISYTYFNVIQVQLSGHFWVNFSDFSEYLDILLTLVVKIGCLKKLKKTELSKEKIFFYF